MIEVQRKRQREIPHGSNYCDKCDTVYVIGAPEWVEDHYHWSNGRPLGGRQWEPRLKDPLERAPASVSLCHGVCVWLCSVCGQPKPYKSKGRKHSGPKTRLLDRRYGLAYCDGSSYPKHKAAFGRIDGARGPVVFYHDGTPNPQQPVQTNPVIKEIEAKYESERDLPKVSRKRKGSGEAPRPTKQRAASISPEGGGMVERKRSVRP